MVRSVYGMVGRVTKYRSMVVTWPIGEGFADIHVVIRAMAIVENLGKSLVEVNQAN